MRKYFSKTALTSRNALINVAFAIAMLSGVGLYNTTILNKDVMDVTVIAAIIVWIGLFPYALKPMLRKYDRETEITKPKRRRTRRFQIVLGFVFIVPFAVYLAIGRGLPILGHYLLSSRGEMTVTIKSKGDYYRKKRCRGPLWVEGHYFMNNQFCLGDEGRWKGVKPGDTLTVKGRKSPLGFSYSTYL